MIGDCFLNGFTSYAVSCLSGRTASWQMRWVWGRPSSRSRCCPRSIMLASKALSWSLPPSPPSPTGRGSSPHGPTWTPSSTTAAWPADRWSSSMRCTARTRRWAYWFWLFYYNNFTDVKTCLMKIAIMLIGALDSRSVQVWRSHHNLWDDFIWLPGAEGDLLALCDYRWGSPP